MRKSGRGVARNWERWAVMWERSSGRRWGCRRGELVGEEG